MEDDTNLFDPSILESLDWSRLGQGGGDQEAPSALASMQDPLRPGPNLRLRPLRYGDHRRGHLQLLAQLTNVGEVSESQYKEQFNRMKASGIHFVVVIEDESKQLIVGTVTFVLEYKFIHSTALRGRLEDVVVLEEYRKHKLGKLLVETVKLLSFKYNIYKLSLDCKDELIPFYTSLGFKKHANLMAIRYWD